MYSRTSSAMKRKKFSTNSGLPGELGPQLRVLRRDADRAGVEVADAHHDAAHDDERRGGEAELLGAHQRRRSRRRGPSSAGRRPARRCDRAACSCTSTCCVSASPSSHGTPPCLIEVSGDAPVPPSWPEISTTSACALATPAATVPTPTSATSFTLMRAFGLRVLQVVDELRQILDRVDVVVRRRRDEPDARRRVPHLRDPRIDLVAGELAALAGLGALRHLDLEIVGVDQVLAGHAEARRRRPA